MVLEETFEFYEEFIQEMWKLFPENDQIVLLRVLGKISTVRAFMDNAKSIFRDTCRN